MPAVSDLKLLWWEKKFCSRRTSFVSRIVNQRLNRETTAACLCDVIFDGLLPPRNASFLKS